MDHALLRLQAWARSRPLLYRLTLGTRILLCVGFIPTGMVKLLGHRFTTMDPATDLGGFFETLYQSGLWWRFLGGIQVLAGILVMIPRTATLGALVFFAIIANIFVITLSYHFRGTPVVTGLMLLATLYLVVWDYHRVRGVFGLEGSDEAGRSLRPLSLSGSLERSAYGTGLVAGLALMLGTRSLWFGVDSRVMLLGVCLACLLVAVGLGLRHARD